ncbi:hypothetical protein HanHA300_Chr08g0279501 [Helianthus annuus]|nr:hypothetical protein HanHA300_Chr08g0279501 [Helianthus annuus]KAJ0553465.1 hypothetical protein HanHA89_Chr08g0296681 [Helianthus annuus]KAJ0719128.1 hypothetical protein HanLR1_Chr08g0278291 [Helianthus annuus]
MSHYHHRRIKCRSTTPSDLSNFSSTICLATDFGASLHSSVNFTSSRVAHYSELAPECVRSYYSYCCALL